MSKTPTTLGQLADLVGGRVHGNSQLTIDGAAVLGEVVNGEITLVDHVDRLKTLNATQASAVVLAEKIEGEFLAGGEVLVAVDAAERAVLRIGEHPGIDGDRRSVLPRAVGVTVTGQAVVVAWRLDRLRLGTCCNREPQKEEGRK